MRGVTPINPQKKIEADSNPVKESDYYEGERLTQLLDLIQRGIETSKLSNVNSLPEKIWLKKQIAIGINEVTRVLERMKSNTTDQQQNPRPPPVQLQVVIVVADCKPRTLTKHIPNLAASRNVLVLYIRDNKRASLRLGELVKLKTALAIGVKARGNDLNLLLQQILTRDS
ncbi:Ribosomal protein L7Ae/L30e/S12e/Gadd45 [Arabidopsis thaliana x Arabidopsis arenosa]|uniref:Ribosomal protein L7Ae/L30e/S12e/Gadd45 n=1 Tax=Arabidopsis thaliana x Arabidopsis arenosa TaxID=1240361 RepID=A0A8T1Z4H9_9BRAS|nr:Ribosomal protein L7Ae/L30e/S12e/Gadd45 [Arabidopsis thaliana x Arabidopsis arenosa]